ncbi:MAG TPA: hypothetical protein VG942_10950 [Hyphomonadaceae bacterium]|nr:hypothetical protein [Hyphomonadaceae bacterium]
MSDPAWVDGATPRLAFNLLERDVSDLRTTAFDADVYRDFTGNPAETKRLAQKDSAFVLDNIVQPMGEFLRSRLNGDTVVEVLLRPCLTCAARDPLGVAEAWRVVQADLKALRPMRDAGAAAFSAKYPVRQGVDRIGGFKDGVFWDGVHLGGKSEGFDVYMAALRPIQEARAEEWRERLLRPG